MTQSTLALNDAPLPSTCALYHGNCLEVMPTMAPNAVALCFADLPYGVTASKKTWDIPIPFSEFWFNVERLGISGYVSALTATQPFATKLISSNMQNFRYDLIWHKRSVGFLSVRRAPLRAHEHVLIFGRKMKTYNAQKTFGHRNYSQKRNVAVKAGDQIYGKINQPPSVNDGSRFPHSIVKHFQAEGKVLHPTQKPVALLEWLIATYTNPGDTVLDPVMGSGTTGVACARLGRNFIGIEKHAIYFEVASKRIANERTRLGLPSNDGTAAPHRPPAGAGQR